ncbi:membrane progestin receptor delta isoform X1 [Hippocampus zosterae]|uniref:membrane progestin receptor delta isoform X1 n=1 Tax=Hippocampus zosterae TaxID=109293 RepID=UPI00223CA5F3|nr:membrane progestin receptor delta isoform X1 [Hippocampus zosterae]
MSSAQRSLLASLEFMLFPVWRGLGAGLGGAWSQGWGRCLLRWEPSARSDASPMPAPDYPVWLLICRRGRARLREVCLRSVSAVDSSGAVFGVKLPPLFDVHQVPKVFREDSILSGYRHPQSSALDCVLSSFHINNETVNIWTHFLPTWYFVWRLASLCSSMNLTSDSYTWPLLAYMLLVCVYPFTSCCAHTFSAMSSELRHICYFFDYGALSLYSLGSAICYGCYVIPDGWLNGWLHRHFVPIAVGNSLLCTSLSCYSRFVEVHFPQRSKLLRTAAFVVPFMFDSLPVFYRLLLCCVGRCSPSEALLSHFYQVTLAFLTCFLFTSHLPERLAPGRFDYFGHSHQLFHVCAVIATHFQMEAVLCDMTSRRALLEAAGPAPSLPGTAGVLALGVALNLGVIALFSAPLLRRAPWQPPRRQQAPGDGKDQ